MDDDLISTKLKPHTGELIPVGSGEIIPLTVADAGQGARYRFFEFFTAELRNANTRAAYHRAVSRFFRWCEAAGLPLAGIRPLHVAAFIEEEGRIRSRPPVKQTLAAIRML